jgi:hypothetical protein
MNSYRERLSPSWWMVVAVGFVMPATVLIFLPLSLPVGVLAGVGMWAGALAILWIFSPVIEVRNGVLRVGNARIDATYIGPVQAFRGHDARHEKGPGAHGLAWMSLRPWVDPVVKITVLDSDDPIPYWLVSTRRPEELISSLGKG